MGLLALGGAGCGSREAAADSDGAAGPDGNEVAMDGASNDDATQAHVAQDASPDGDGSGRQPPADCAGGCSCFMTPDACTHGCTPTSGHEADGSVVFGGCSNFPLGTVCGTSNGRCIRANAPCADPLSELYLDDCDPWPSTGAFCCLDSAGTLDASQDDGDGAGASTDDAGCPAGEQQCPGCGGPFCTAASTCPPPPTCPRTLDAGGTQDTGDDGAGACTPVGGDCTTVPCCPGGGFNLCVSLADAGHLTCIFVPMR
jgi:hypothetical protein